MQALCREEGLQQAPCGVEAIVQQIGLILLDDDGLSVWMAGEQDKPEASRKYAWHDMHLAYRTPNAIYLYVQQNQAYLLNDSLDAAWSLLQASLPAERLHDMR